MYFDYPEKQWGVMDQIFEKKGTHFGSLRAFSVSFPPFRLSLIEAETFD